MRFRPAPNDVIALPNTSKHRRRGALPLIETMTALISHRMIHVEELRARLGTHALLHEHYRLHAVHNEVLTVEDTLAVQSYSRLGRVERPIATILLDGAARITVHGESAWLE